MKLSQLKTQLSELTELNFQLPDGSYVPKHFHVTEVGELDKKFIDCGGKVRRERIINFQLWKAEDFDHRLAPQKLNSIIALSENILGIADGEIEVEYQGDTIGKYGLEFNGKDFLLTKKTTACLAEDQCGITPLKQKIKLSELSTNSNSCCGPNSNCC